MRSISVIITSLFYVQLSFAQDTKVQQWKAIVSQTKKDTTTLAAMDSLSNWYGNYQTDSGMYYLLKMKELAEVLNKKNHVIKALRLSAEGNFTKGKTADALKEQYKALSLAEELNDSSSIARGYSSIGNSHKEYGDYAKALFVVRHAKATL